MGPTPAWDLAAKRWYELSEDIRIKANGPYREGIKGHEDDLDYCARVLEDAMDWALEECGISFDLSRKADEYDEIIRAMEIMEGLR